MPVARAPHSHSLHVQNAVHAFKRPRDLLLQSLRSRVQQGVQSAPAELRPDPQDHPGDGQARQRVRVNQPRQIPGLAGPHQPDSGDDHRGAPNIGRKMQRIRLQRFARIFPGRLPEGPCPSKVDEQGDA